MEGSVGLKNVLKVMDIKKGYSMSYSYIGEKVRVSSGVLDDKERDDLARYIAGTAKLYNGNAVSLCSVVFSDDNVEFLTTLHNLKVGRF